MSVVQDIWTNFSASISDCRALYGHCLAPFSAHSEAGIEGAFLQAFKSLEVLFEELAVAYLSGEPDLAGVVPPASVTCISADVARQVLMGSRGYSDWSDPDEVRRRLSLYFRPGSLDDRLNGMLAELREAKVCRNGIAHASGTAARKLADLWLQKHGTAKTPLRCADILRHAYPPNPGQVWFDRYVAVMEAAGGNLCML